MGKQSLVEYSSMAAERIVALLLSTMLMSFSLLLLVVFSMVWTAAVEDGWVAVSGRAEGGAPCLMNATDSDLSSA